MGRKLSVGAAKRYQQKLSIIVDAYTRQSSLSVDKALVFLEASSPELQSATLQALKDAAGRKQADTVKALKERARVGAVPPPPARTLGPHAKDRVKQLPQRPAYGSHPEMIVALGEIVNKVRKQNPAVFDEVYKRLGAPSSTELAAILHRPAMWAALDGKGEQGQANVLLGELFQMARKMTPEFAASLIDGDRKRRAFNQVTQRRRLSGSSPSPAALSAQPEDFGPPAYYDKVQDGNKKQLSDGMVASWNARGHVLITNIDEAKAGERGRQDAPEQQDSVLRRAKQFGVILGGILVPPENIHLPVRSGLPGTAGVLTAYYEGAAGGTVITPSGHLMKTIGVPVPGLHDFALAILKEWNKLILGPKR